MEQNHVVTEVRDGRKHRRNARYLPPCQGHAPACTQPGERCVGALLLCAAHTQWWPRTWGELQAQPGDAPPQV